MPNFGDYKHDVSYGTLYQLYIEEGLSSSTIVVCPSCHAKEHEEERRRDERGRYL